MPDTSFVRHRGQRIMVVDFTVDAKGGLESPAYVERSREAFAEATAVVAEQAPGSLLLLNDFANASFNIEIVGLAKAYAESNTRFVRYSALVGVNPLQRIVVNATARLMGRPIKVFAERRDALDWLVDQVETEADLE